MHMLQNDLHEALKVTLAGLRVFERREHKVTIMPLYYACQACFYYVLGIRACVGTNVCAGSHPTVHTSTML